MIRDIALIPIIFNQPLVAIGGIIVFLFLLFTALVGLLNYRGIRTIPFKWHPRLAVTTATLALIHGILAASITIGF